MVTESDKQWIVKIPGSDKTVPLGKEEDIVSFDLLHGDDFTEIIFYNKNETGTHTSINELTSSNNINDQEEYWKLNSSLFGDIKIATAKYKSMYIFCDALST